MSANKEGILRLPFDSLKASGETAPHRSQPSFPARKLLESGLLEGKIFDWGCGHGYDLGYFRDHGFPAEGWDPIHFPQNPPESFAPGSFGVVHCAFVLNTLPDPLDRQTVLRDISIFLNGSGFVSLTVRSQSDINSHRKPTWKKFGDGWLTSRGTFQRGYTAEELLKIVSPIFKDITVVSKNPLFIVAVPVD